MRPHIKSFNLVAVIMLPFVLKLWNYKNILKENQEDLISQN